ncbi:MAG: hypothetical protein ABR499_08910 [Gemmatimonadaceae bacterium]
MRLTQCPIAYVLAFCVSCLPSVATGQAAAIPRDLRRWGVALYLGSSVGGPASDLESAMTAGGYTEPFGGCDPFFGCVPQSPSPSSYSHANPWLLSIRYRARGPFGVELLLGQASAGTTSGRRSGETLDIEYGGSVAAPLASVGTPYLRVGVGPALLRSRWDYRDSNDGSKDRVTTRAFGWIGNAAFAVPLWSSFEVSVIGQYRGFGATRVGPSPSGAPTLAAATVRSAHFYAAGGLGMTF